MSRHDVNSILCYVSKGSSADFRRAFFVKLVFLIKIRLMSESRIKVQMILLIHKWTITISQNFNKTHLNSFFKNYTSARPVVNKK